MGFRDKRISKSVLRAIFHGRAPKIGLLARILAFFSIFQLTLARYKENLFKKLRTDVWQLDEDEYRESFREAEKGGSLKSVGDLGYSGSTFFTTPNSKYLIKSLPRHSEHHFFRETLLPAYYSHISTHPSSLLVRITDLLYSPFWSLGRVLRTAPSHHIVMENILYGKEADAQKDKWETYDLKPTSYFYPERDVAGGRLASESVKERLVDKFEDKIRITASQRDELLDILAKDTKLLAENNAIDYSLFLIRYPAPPPRDIAAPDPRHPFREGVKSTDGKWVYRMVLLDFFWAKHTLQAKTMTALIRSFNFFAGHDDMSITTTPGEYRERFLGMVGEMVEVREGGRA
ncbi:hypothetical protein H2201_003177 [Coniosporium apollinis]|uniref:PIPK domain-containing protein n=1 Tax=Coniosporium apollinis TaxID=61459 RepID=A0ABQ9P1P1_9PEZI|nr:hypothetical protein H2201_003177 [Coniosporium apollinis]